MHRRGVCHADLKPNNVMLSKAGDVKIIDYGLAWIKGEGKGRVQGTPEYMAPEQGRKGTVNERTDIFNLGATMYRMLTFRLPPVSFGEEIELDAPAWAKMLTPVRKLNPKVPKELDELVMRCLAFKPTDRPERASEVQSILDRLVDDMVKEPEDQLDALEW
jgi:serine/threonine protein kinase